jgi:hypothetical protein
MGEHWERRGPHRDGSDTICDASGRAICALMPWEAGNANLIAAAPVMLAALKQAAVYLARVEGQGEGGTTSFDVAAEAVRAAIGRAQRGETLHKAVWNILHKHCGARAEMPDDFAIHWPECREYRFMGALGFGGKIYADPREGMRVGCYPEHDTPERKKMIETANQELASIHEKFDWGH